MIEDLLLYTGSESFYLCSFVVLQLWQVLQPLDIVCIKILRKVTNMKKYFALIVTSIFLFFSSPAFAVDVTMGSGGNLVFEPSEISISAGDTVHFVNGMLPPHNVIVEDHPELSHDGLLFAPGENFDVTFTEAGDYTYWCAPHKGAGMIGKVHVQ